VISRSPSSGRRRPPGPARWAAACLSLAAGLVLAAHSAWAQDTVHHTVNVGVLRDAPPFSYQAADGSWEGLAVEMWNLVADELHLDSRFLAMDRSEMPEAVAAGRVRFGIGPLAITAERVQRVDFSAPIDVTGMAIAVPYVARGIGGVLRDALFSAAFLNLAAGVLALLAVVGTIFWVVERNRNPDFAGRHIHGWGSGIWLSIVTMTTVGYGDKAPRTLGGRAVAALWMFVSIVLISIFTGTVATLLTAERMGARVNGFEDLDSARVACVAASAGLQLMHDWRRHCQQFPDLETALQALVDRRADAVVHDRALLAWALKQRADLPIKILPGTLRPEYYAFAMAPDEPLRRPINAAISRILDSPRWSQFRFAYLGNDAEYH
jgi:ABC-type amino acid transport substrate-binding protein